MKRPDDEVTIGHLENKNKFEVSNNTNVTTSIQRNVNGNMNTPSEKYSKPL